MHHALIIACSFFLLCDLCTAQPLPPEYTATRILLNGKIKVAQGTDVGVLVLAMKDGVAMDLSMEDRSELDMWIDRNSGYLFSFQKYDHITKELFFDTHIPAEERTEDPLAFPFQVLLEPQPKEGHARYIQPVGVIYYDVRKKKLVYVKDYTLVVDPSIRERVEHALAQHDQFKERVVSSWEDVEMGDYLEPIPTTTALEEPRTGIRYTGMDPAEADTGSIANDLMLPNTDNGRDVEALTTKDTTELLVDRNDEGSTVVLRDVMHGSKNTSTKSEKDKQAYDTNLSNVPKRARTASFAHPYNNATVSEISEEITGSGYRKEHLIQEKLRVTTVIEIGTSIGSTVYRRVAHAYGPVFHFKDAVAISEEQFIKEVGR